MLHATSAFRISKQRHLESPGWEILHPWFWDLQEEDMVNLEELILREEDGIDREMR